MPNENTVTEAVSLCCDTIGELDAGIARHLVDAEIEKALDDLNDRAEEDGKERVVTIQLTMGLSNGLMYVNVAAQAKVPPRKSRNTAGKVRMRAKGHHEMLFMADTPENPSQPAFADLAGEADE